MTDTSNAAPPRPVVIVDAFGRGSVLAKAFAERVPCIHVASRADIPDLFLASLQRDLFVECLHVAGLPEGLIAARRRCVRLGMDSAAHPHDPRPRGAERRR